MTSDRLAIVGVVAAFVLLALGAQSGMFAQATGALFGSAVGLKAPTLDDPAMIRRGAGHYDRVCAACHGSPDRPDRAAALDLSPSPPRLHDRLEAWSPEALFETVKRGVPGTGMPAWPVADRDDEIWSMVAFLTALPGMDAATYRDLAGTDRAASHEPGSACARCHGADGRGTPDGAFPRLDIQSPDYLYAALAAFRDGRRSSGFMLSVVAGLRDDELRALAERFGRSAAIAPAIPPPAPTGSAVACIACHGAPRPARSDFPSLAGQYESYLHAQFELLSNRERPRGGGAFVPLMHEAARLAAPADAAAWLAWYAAAR